MHSSNKSIHLADRVGFWESCAFGVGFLVIFFGNAAVKSFAIPVYQMTMGVNPLFFALLMAIPRLLNAVTDPLIGYVSDHLDTRWGRRKPLIVVGSLLQAVAFGIIWMVPANISELETILYLMVSLFFFYSFHSIFSVPFMALGYELTPDYFERTRVHSFGVFFGKLGEFSYQWVYPLTQLAVFGSVLVGIRMVGWGVGIVVMGIVGLFPGFFVKERYFKKAVSQNKAPLFQTVAGTFKNRAFVLLVALSTIQIIAGIMASSVDYYLLVYSLCDGNIKDGSIWKAVLSMGYAIIGIVSIWGVNRLSRWLGKEKALACIFMTLFLGAIVKWNVFTPGNGGWFFEQLDHLLDLVPFSRTEGNHWKILFDPLFCGPVWIATNMIVPSMLADVCDEDELKHAQRREGMFASVFSWIQKTGYSFSFLGTGIALVLTGFDEQLGQHQPEGTFWYLRLYLCLSTAVWAIISIFILKFYPLSRERMATIRIQLEEKRGQLNKPNSTLNTEQ